MARIPILALLLAIFPLSVYGQGVSAKCTAPELVGQQPYDELVCSGLELMARREYRRAIEVFEEAMSIDLYDFPNFMLYPRLALTHHLLGEKKSANFGLKKGELALLVYTRVLSCEETQAGFMIVNRAWGASRPVDSPHRDEVAKRMCGAAYDYIYHPTIEQVASQSDLVKSFLQIRRQILTVQ